MPDAARRCRYCDEPLPPQFGPAARYCCRAHRQRAYEAERAKDVDSLRRQVVKLRRALAIYERILEDIADDPACAPRVEDVLTRHITALHRARRAAAAARGE